MSASFTTTEDRKPKGWFSRRHQTGTAHEEARATYLVNHGPEARREYAQQRAGVSAGNTEGQVAVLDNRLGSGVGAKRERARLAAA